MGLFDFFKKSKNEISTQEPTKPSVSEEGEKLDRNTSHYTDVAFSGTPFEKRVISFEERKKTAIPSKTGLYPAEILLLEYCSYGTYPNPQKGYPSFWWFEYGIKDIDAALKSLESRGYIAFASAKDSLHNFTIAQLKALLSSKDLSTSGKKTDLVTRAAASFSEVELLAAGVQNKYILTELGQQELTENKYVSYMHKVRNKTTEDTRFGIPFNVWSINKLLGTGDKSNWEAVVAEQEQKLNQKISDDHEKAAKTFEQIDSNLFTELKRQDQQLAAIQAARKSYDESKDIDTYIVFWETLWKNGGLTFSGSKWHFELADLYITVKRYSDALHFLRMLKQERKEYADKADSYIARIEKLIQSQAK